MRTLTRVLTLFWKELLALWMDPRGRMSLLVPPLVQGLVFGYTNGYFEYFLPAWEYGLSFETEHTQVPKGEPERICDKFCQASRLLGSNS